MDNQPFGLLIGMLTALIAGGRALLNLLQSQLSFYGAIDEAVLYAKDGSGENPDAVLRIVGTLLPNTTGFGQSGWYHELLDFANRRDVRNPDCARPYRFPVSSSRCNICRPRRRRSGCGSPPPRWAPSRPPSPLRSPGPSPLPRTPAPGRD